jgi:hypothetical protein
MGKRNFGPVLNLLHSRSDNLVHFGFDFGIRDERKQKVSLLNTPRQPHCVSRTFHATQCVFQRLCVGKAILLLAPEAVLGTLAFL